MAAVDLMMAFGVRWAENGTVEVIDESQWRAGWAFIGATPPSVEQFNKVQRINDQKAEWLYQQMLAVMQTAGETPTVGDLTSLRDSINTNLSNKFPALLSANGWQKLSSGLILQWGGVTGFSSYTVNFPIAFPNNSLVLFGINNGTAGTISCTTAYIDNTKFGLWLSSVGSAYWFAIGY